MSELRFLPDANWRLEGGSGRQPAQRINDLAADEREQSVTWTARGALLPINYGRRDVVGLLGPHGKIGTDLVIAYIWGIGPIDAIEAVYLNDAALPGSGVSVQHYLGTPTQDVDPWLASAVAGFNDRMRVPTRGGFRGVAYTVLRITEAAAVEGFPRARALGRWLANIRDPRGTPSVGYSDNPALCLANWLEDQDFGLDGAVEDTGLAACANWDDSLLGGVLPRCRIGISLTQGRPSRDYARLLSEYAECFFVEEGEGFRMIPDAPVDLATTPIISAADLARGSLALRCVEDLDTPTEITVQYTEPGSTAAQPWALQPTEPSALPGVAEGTTTRVPTSVTLDGVNRYEEGKNKADSRLARQQNRITANWRGFDAGVLYQPGDVVRLQNDARGVDLLAVRITNVAISAAGRHSFTAERYDAAHYPADLTPPGSYGTVPVGAIAMLSGSTVPAGWADYSAANGRYIIAGGGAYAPGATGGVTLVSHTADTGDGGSHSVNDHSEFTAESDTPPPTTSGRDYTLTLPTAPPHRHSLVLAGLDPQLYTRTDRLVVKTTDPSITIPASVRVFGLPNVSLPGLERVTSAAGRLLAAGASAGNSGTTSRNVAVTTASADDAHAHYSSASASGEVDFPPYPTYYRHESGGGVHTHALTLAVEAAVKRFRLPVWGGGADYRVAPGMIFLWAGTVAAIPADWALCDGTSGTPDVLGRYIEIAGIGNELTAAGDNTIRLHGTTDQKGHTHQGGGLSRDVVSQQIRGGTTINHDHPYDQTIAYQPAYFALLPIMYVPGA